jgi:hypothetical protein
VSLGYFATRAAALAADREFVRTGQLPKGCALSFKHVHLAPDGLWNFEYKGCVTGGFANAVEAARARRRDVDNDRQRARRAELKTVGKKRRRAVAPQGRRRCAKPDPFDAEAAPTPVAEECLLVDFMQHKWAAPWLDL